MPTTKASSTIAHAVARTTVAASMGEWNYIATHLLTNLFMRALLTTVALLGSSLINRKGKR